MIQRARALGLVAVSITDHDALDGAFGRIERELGPPDVLVANAGIGIRGPALEVPAADFDRVVEVNLTRALAR